VAALPERQRREFRTELLFENDIVFVNFAVQRVTAYAQRLRGAADIPVHSFELTQQ